MKQARELRLFDEVQVPRVKAGRPGGGSRTPIVFHDYESYVAKAKATKVIPIELSAREMKIVEGLGVEC